MQLFATNPNIDFMRVRRPAGMVSILLLIASVVLLATRGLNPGIDFKGGVLVELGYEQPVELSSVREALSEAQLGSASVQYFGTQTDVLVRMAPDETNDAAEISDRILAALRTVGQDPEMRRVEFVGAAVGDELAIDGALAALFALIGILIYVAFRFEWKFAVGAIAATSHDAIIVLGWFSLLGLEFDLTVLAAVLATIGYSLNDTIVVYDRVRERFLDLRRSEPVDVINSAVNQTLARTIVTSGTTLFVLLALFFLGGSVVHNFSTALIVGILVGTYSSIFVASGLLPMLGVKHEDLLPPQDEDEVDELP
ncbi:protein translocase subunit SecF [Algiphilus sp.]|uniref:protein translocase subunit SecF n=1 Tax=Algiphilus sp. TaxID=1872431 RepID=UPI003B51A335